jgi:selenocysteine lyase/cysteine desulfurase
LRVLTPAYDLEAWRRRIPLLRTAVPMNACSQAPQMDATRDAAEPYLQSWRTSGMDWDGWMHEVSLARAAFARLIGADADEVAVTSSVSEAVSSLASAVDFSSGRRTVVATRAEFPTVGHVWLAHEPRGACVRWIPVRGGIVPLGEYERAVDDDTAVVSATHAYYLNGQRQDLRAIADLAHSRGALLFADAYQSLGVSPVDVKALGVDALASGALKFLMGIPGIAFLFVRRELLERLQPTVTGWFGRANPFAFDVATLDWAAGASKFDTGTPPIINAYVARAGIEVIEQVGPTRIAEWGRVLARALIDGGRTRGLVLHGPDDVDRKTPTTAFVVGEHAHAIESAMRERGVIASARGEVIRLAPHFYSSLDDCERALDVLAECVRECAPA